MKIEKGMKCRFIDPCGIECKGEVLCVGEKYFTVWERSKVHAQYVDGIRDCTEADIGKTVWFD